MASVDATKATEIRAELKVFGVNTAGLKAQIAERLVECYRITVRPPHRTFPVPKIRARTPPGPSPTTAETPDPMPSPSTERRIKRWSSTISLPRSPRENFFRDGMRRDTRETLALASLALASLALASPSLALASLPPPASA